MRRGFYDDPKWPVHEETHHCTDCGWEGYPEARFERMTVGHGNSWGEYANVEELWCPECSGEVDEGPLPNKECDDE